MEIFTKAMRVLELTLDVTFWLCVLVIFGLSAAAAGYIIADWVLT